MGTLKPGATYVYERSNGFIYARESRESPDKRFVIGNDLSITRPETSGLEDLEDHKLWMEIRLAAKKNPALQKACDRVKLIYKIIKDSDNERKN